MIAENSTSAAMAAPLASAGTVLVVVQNARSIPRVAGSLGHFAARKYRVHLYVAEDPPGSPSLELFDGRYPRLSVACLPLVSDAQWLRPVLPAPEVVSLLARLRPAAVIVTRLEGAEVSHLDFQVAARSLGIPSIFLALDVDDVACGDLNVDAPDCVAVWNRAQRQEAVERGVAARRTCVTGAHLLTDVLEGRTAGSRSEYCRRLGIEPERSVVLIAPPASSPVTAWMRAWNDRRMSSGDPVARDAAVVAFTRSTEAASSLRESRAAGLADVIDGDIRTDLHVVAERLHEAVTHADCVVTADADLALEAFARARPVVAAADGDGRLERLCERMRRELEWPLSATSTDEQLNHLASILNGTRRLDGLAAARGFVRIHGDEVEPAFLLAARLVRQVPSPKPHARGVVPAPRAAAAVRRGGKALFLLVMPSPVAFDGWASLISALVGRGHRVLVAFAESEPEATVHPPRTIHGVAVAGAVPGTTAWNRVATAVSAVRLFAPILRSERSATASRWRARLDGASLPGPVRALSALAGRDTRLERARRLAAIVDGGLPASAAAAQLMERHQPDAVIALPSLDGSSVVGSWAAHAAVLRAARARNIPAAASLPGGDAVEEALAHCALKARGVSRVNAEAAAAEIEGWLERTRASGAAVVPRPSRAIGAGALLACTIWTARGAASVNRHIRSVRRATSRTRGAVTSAIRRVVRSEP